jgi:NADPH-dependent F420 reductase
MRVGILGGTGPEGRGLALRLSQAGVPVIIGSRNPEQAALKAEELRFRLKEEGGPGADIGGRENSGVVEASDILIIAVPFEHAAGLLESCRGRLRQGQILVDVTVPLQFRSKRLELRELPEPSASEHLAGILPEGVPLVAAFKTIPAHLLEDLSQRLDCHVFVCGDSAEARGRIVQVASAIEGLSPLDVGRLRQAATLERMTVLAIQINKRHRVHNSRFRVVGL